MAEATLEALNQLSVSERDAEIVVLSESKPGLFGRVRTEARVRARARLGAANATHRSDQARGPSLEPGEAGASTGAVDSSRRAGRQQARLGPSAQRGPSGTQDQAGEGKLAAAGTWDGETPPSMTSSAARQEEVAQAFLVGVLARFGIPASVGVAHLDDGVTEVRVTGSDLAVLVGTKGATVDALQDLTRVVVQRRTGALRGRLLVDVAGYRQRRRQALEVFARQRAEEVLKDHQAQVLEPMAPADRRVVHATINSIDGVDTRSEGEEPDRRVVISPSG